MEKPSVEEINSVVKAYKSVIILLDHGFFSGQLAESVLQAKIWLSNSIDAMKNEIPKESDNEPKEVSEKV